MRSHQDLELWSFIHLLSVRAAAAGALAAAFLILGTAPAAAQTGAGLRAGLSVNPDQAFVGAHVETGPLAERLFFKPNVEIGFGDNVTTTAINLDLVWRFERMNQSPWEIYAGGGPAINVFRFQGRSETEAGANFLVGLEHHQGFFTEFRLGVGDSPDYKLTLGFTFR